MVNSKFQMQIEYIDLKTKAIKVDVLEGDKIIKKTLFTYNELTFTEERIVSDIKDFILNSNLDVEGKINFVYTSSSCFHTTIVLPKTSKMKIFLDNEISDKFRMDYKEKFSTYISTESFHKDATISFVCVISNDVVTKFHNIAKGLNLQLGEITSISMLLAEKEYVNSLLKDKKSTHISVFIRNCYSVINVVVNSQLVLTSVIEEGYQELTKQNVVKRLKSIQSVNTKVFAMAGQNELFLKNTPVEDFYLYCKDENLRKQFLNKKLHIPYFFMSDEGFISDIFKKNVFNTKKLKMRLARGFTLIETIVSVAVFALVTTSMVALIYSCIDVSKKDEFLVKRCNFLTNMAYRYHEDPVNYLSYYYADTSSISAPSNYTVDGALVYVDENFKPVSESSYVYKITFSRNTSSDIKEGGTGALYAYKYVASISSILDTNAKQKLENVYALEAIKNS